MRFRLFLILIGVVVLSLASGLGLRYALAWTEPGADPPDGNVPKPINVGADSQTKTGGLTIGGNFFVGGRQVVGAPAGGDFGVGSINAQKICINGDCLTSWAGGQAFVQNGNAFGELATLGTNDNFPLAFETNGVGRMYLDTAGNVGIGTINPQALLSVNNPYGVVGTINPIVVSQLAGQTAALGGLYSVAEGDLNGASGLILNVFKQGVGLFEGMRILNSGNVGVGTTNPLYKLTIAGSAPRTYLWPSGGGNPELDFGNVVGDSHWGVYRANGDATNDLRFWYGTSAGVGENNVTMTTAGDITSRRCFGPVYTGQTAATYNGARGGYISANALCAASVSGSHVCTTSEILETVRCNSASLPVADQAWISNGPPGYTARANDCTGWTSTSPAGSTLVYGAIWAFDASGGVGWVTTCNQSLKFACCK